jgi:hypothetical protein
MRIRHELLLAGLLVSAAMSGCALYAESPKDNPRAPWTDTCKGDTYPLWQRCTVTIKKVVQPDGTIKLEADPPNLYITSRVAALVVWTLPDGFAYSGDGVLLGNGKPKWNFTDGGFAADEWGWTPGDSKSAFFRWKISALFSFCQEYSINVIDRLGNVYPVDPTIANGNSFAGPEPVNGKYRCSY